MFSLSSFGIVVSASAWLFGSHCAAGLRRPTRGVAGFMPTPPPIPVERNQFGAECAGEPKVACITGGQTRCLSEVQRSRVIEGDALHSQPMRQPENGAQSLPLAWLAPDLDQANVSQFEVKQGGRRQSGALEPPGNRFCLSANSRAASAEASTALMPIGPDGGRVGRRAEAKAPNFCEELGGA